VRDLVNQHVRFIEPGGKRPLMTYEKALNRPSQGQEIPVLD
jgi:hypothetical protein